MKAIAVSPTDRWAAIGPYYAMFPSSFANQTVLRYTQPGAWVLDPFAGRGTGLYAAAVHGRNAIGVEINPLGWLYARVKLGPAPLGWVTRRLSQLREIPKGPGGRAAAKLPEFFHRCFAPEVLRFLCTARKELRWRQNSSDASLMALILVYLHGKRGQALSNQMRQTKAMAPDYSIAWWKANRLRPPSIDPYEFLLTRIVWRYGNGVPELGSTRVMLGDSRVALKGLAGRRVDLLFTSPPYRGITNYHYDQWLRLWLLGGNPHAGRLGESCRGKFESREQYRALLEDVFRACRPLLKRDAVIYVRTDAREETFEDTFGILREVFPNRRTTVIGRPMKGRSQTVLYGDKTQKPGEKDIILR